MPSFVQQARAKNHQAMRSDDVGMRGRTDLEHLEYAAEKGLVLVTCNRRDFQGLHLYWLSQGRAHSGIIIVDQRLSLGERIRVLLWLAQAGTAEDFANRFEFLDEWR